MQDLIIIGAGPAGVSAALYAKSRGINFLLFEKDSIGGTISRISSVTHFTGISTSETGKTFKCKLKKQLSQANIVVSEEEVIGVSLNDKIKKVKTLKNEYEAKAVIVAAGTIKRRLCIPGEDEFKGRGIGLNAVLDGDKYKDKSIYVVGGADGAMKEALYLSKLARRLVIIHFEDKLGCIKEFRDKIKEHDNISLMLHSRLIKVEGDCCVNKLFIKDEHTNLVTEIDDKECGVFVYAGSSPNTEMFNCLKLINGFIEVDENMKSSIDGVYAVGDIRYNKVKQIATAVSDGAIAAINCFNYISQLK